ncbi:histidine phosphotransferase family protein [Novosphingobium pituita]|jgi:histidine phosphotransferase ChpT|uniref:Histidine phosphotransferase family protein n=1 Tax=Novosphingobium pituita TaxID=3056842 RepID=A0ABQ6P8S5_9SPHN|nr:histidine phosphotransferase family protein [Novosphingobium sp. IK01]MDK4807481.1 histidine phosphotransferase family protein [Novosphingobium aromaticivorans]GMM61658.1 histidine phosphotransferase family protein [Novosphingobium sp. IK01]HIQ16963.1 histidine phosphotransferase [Novosphingobium capsulatum]
MTTSSLDLASLLCSRLCHDLLSPVGALTNGLELLAEEKDPVMRQKCFELLEQSATASANKLRFFRLAFGAAGGFGEMVPVAEARALIDALVAANPRITVQWSMADETLPKSAIKTLLNLSMIGIEALVRGGVLDIAGEVRAHGASGAGLASELVIRASGPRIAFDPLVAQALAGTLPLADLSSRTAPAAMLFQLAQGLGGSFQTHVTADALVLGAVLPVR